MTNTPERPEDEATAESSARDKLVESLGEHFAGWDAPENQTMTEDRFMELSELSSEERRGRLSPKELAEFEQLDQALQRIADKMSGQPAQHETHTEAMASRALRNYRDQLAQEARARIAPIETNELLMEVARTLVSVESSNRNTEGVLVEIKAHREAAGEQQRKQNRINVLLSVAAVLAGVGSIVVPLFTRG